MSELRPWQGMVCGLLLGAAVGLKLRSTSPLMALAILAAGTLAAFVCSAWLWRDIKNLERDYKAKMDVMFTDAKRQLDELNAEAARERRRLYER